MLATSIYVIIQGQIVYIPMTHACMYEVQYMSCMYSGACGMHACCTDGTHMVNLSDEMGSVNAQFDLHLLDLLLCLHSERVRVPHSTFVHWVTE